MDETTRSQYLFEKNHKKCCSFFNEFIDLKKKYKNESHDSSNRFKNSIKLEESLELNHSIDSFHNESGFPSIK